MAFPLDPSAPGGPDRSDYIRSQYVTVPEPVAQPKHRSSGIAVLRHLRRLEIRTVTSPCPG